MLYKFFNRNVPTRVIIHGWLGDYKSEVNTGLRNALLNSSNYNVIVVDWGEVAKSYNYMHVWGLVPDVGKQLARFFDFLNKKGVMEFSKLMVMGYSLGAHVAGYAGKRVTRGKIHHIIGLDPALPLFIYKFCSRRLCHSDATYVESIQTCGNVLGFLTPIGKAAFYPNGGIVQPGCELKVFTCSHSRAYLYLAEAIQRNSFISVECKSYEDAVKKKCGSNYSKVRMGTGYGNSGVFFVPVNEKPPYGKG